MKTLLFAWAHPQTLYRDLRGEISWSPAHIGFKNLSLQTLNGSLRFDGSWLAGDEPSKSLNLVSQIDSIDVQTLMSQIFPERRNRLEGQLNFRGRFNATTQSGRIVQSGLKGSGETEISHGTIKDFNLISQFLLRGSDSSASSKISSLLPTSLIALLDQRDTPFDTLKASFTVEQKRVRTDNFSLSTPDYTITAAGWMGFDGETKWNGSLVLAPWVTQALQRDYRMIRYLLDRRGRLSISFRAEGTLPNITVRPENRALAQALRGRSSPKANVPSASSEKDQNKVEKRGWLPESLNQLLHR